MYAIIELQTMADGQVATPPLRTAEEENEAWSIFYQVASVAAVSSVPLHTVILVNNMGDKKDSRCFAHPAAE